MENRELIIAAIVAAVVVVAVLAAGYMILAGLTGGPGPTPTAAPAQSPTIAPGSTIPSGPFNPTHTPSGSAPPAIPTPMQPVVKSAELVGWGTDKDSYNKGETATTYIIIKNTGTVPIDEAQLGILVERYVSVIGYVNVQNSKQPLIDLGIQPGETKKIEYNITIPADYQGISTSGKYRFTVDVYVWDVKIGGFQKEVEVK